MLERPIVVRSKTFNNSRTIELDSSEEFDPDDNVLLRMQYPDLEHITEDIKEKHDLGSISDSTFEDLKKAWSITRSFIERKPQPPEERQGDFVRPVLDTRSDRRGSRSKYNLKSKSWKAWEEFMAATGATNSEILEESPEMSDLDFMAPLQPFVEKYPSTSELRDHIVDLFRSYQAMTETRLLDEHMGSVMGKEEDRRLKGQKELQANLFRLDTRLASMPIRHHFDKWKTLHTKSMRLLLRMSLALHGGILAHTRTQWTWY
ncbi:hypothetical protein FRC09_002859 [Ceratobasidium sp. 395]|nr:hypothetical protein FRC09_002859 [Ceratobasidium sp. 395]